MFVSGMQRARFGTADDSIKCMSLNAQVVLGWNTKPIRRGGIRAYGAACDCWGRGEGSEPRYRVESFRIQSVSLPFSHLLRDKLPHQVRMNRRTITTVIPAYRDQ